ncbi:MAG: M50 family metallopeptidase [Melioribacteraceae bacterium]|nr:M50 family metallopeptidase [Melioribacteraceae bacterium]
MNLEQKKITQLIFNSLVILFTIAFWDIKFFFPIKVISILFHELSHGFAAILSGGVVNSISIQESLDGVTQISGGNDLFIAFSGYSGSLLFGMIIFYSSIKLKTKNFILIAIGVLLFIATINLIEGFIGIFTGISYSIMFIILGMLEYGFIKFVVRYLGLVILTYSTADIIIDLLTSNNQVNDAIILSVISSVSPIVWGLLFFILSIAAIIVMLRFDFKSN